MKPFRNTRETAQYFRQCQSPDRVPSLVVLNLDFSVFVCLQIGAAGGGGGGVTLRMSP